MLGQVTYQGQVLQRVLSDRSHLIVDEQAREQDAQAEDLNINICRALSGGQTLGVDKDHVHIGGERHRSIPHPDAFRAGLSGTSNIESFALISRRLARKDFPVRYGPAIDTTASLECRGSDSKNIMASVVTSNFPLFSSMVMNCMALPLGSGFT